jgi:hypothetical protein
MDLIQVVPSLPPRLDGIGDYARKLAVPLLKEQGFRTHFVVCKPEWVGGPVDGFEATPLATQSAAAFLESISKIETQLGVPGLPILVHFAVYGYQNRGVPFWLADALEEIHRRRSNTLHVLFHELEANDSRPWRSVFWLSALQSRIIRRAALAADYRYTNADLFRSKLEMAGIADVSVIPNFSTMGEPEEYPSWSNRTNSLVIFGQSAQRGRAYAFGAKVLEAICDSVRFDRVLDIGDSLGAAVPKQIGATPVVQCGRLPETEIRKMMATSVASFLTYPVPLLPKSSIFAVSRAFGTVPFVYDHETMTTSCPGIEAGKDYILINDSDFPVPTNPPIEELSLQVFRRYQAHKSANAALKIAANLLRSSTPRGS